MFGSQFMLKTMIAVFALPLVAKADIHLDLKPLKSIIFHQDVSENIDTAQIRAAVKTISATAQMNGTASYHTPIVREEETPYEKTDQEHLAELLANIEALSKQAEQTN